MDAGTRYIHLRTNPGKEADLLSKEGGGRSANIQGVGGSVSDPHPFFADPDPT